MDVYWKENTPPWPGGHLKSGQRLVQKNVGVSLSVGNGRDTKMVSCRTQSKRTVPAILPGLGPGRRLELGRPVVSRKLSALVQTNLAPAGQPLQDATSLVSNSGFEQQSNLQPRAWRPRASGPWRGFSFQQSNMKLSRADPERRGGRRSSQTLERPDGNLAGCSRELLCPRRSGSASWLGRPKSQTHGYPFPRDKPSSSSFPSLGNTVQVSPKATKAQGSELSPPPRSGHQDCLVQPSPRLQSTSGCWAPDPVRWSLTLEDLGISGRCQRSTHPPVSGPRTKLSPSRLLLSMRHLEWPTELLRTSQEQPRTWPHSNRVTSPEASPTLTPGHPSPLTHPCKAAPPEAAPHLTPEHPRPLTVSRSTVSPVVSLDLTPRHPSPLTLSHSTVSPMISPDLTPGHPSPLTHPCRAVPPDATPHLTPGHPSPLTHPCRAVPPEATPHLTTEHPSPLTVSRSTVSPVISPDLTSGHPSPLTLSHSTVSPVISPNMTSGHPSPLTLSHSTVSPVISLDLISGHSSPLTLSHSAVSPAISPDLPSGHPSPLTVSHSTMSPVISPDLTPGHPSPLSLPHSTVSPEALPNRTPRYPSLLSFPHGPVIPEASPSLTPGYPNLHTVSSKTLAPEASPCLTRGCPRALILSHRAVTPETSPSQTPGYPNFSGPSSQAGFPNLKVGHPNPLTLSGSTQTSGNPNSSTLSHSPLTPDPSSSFPSLSHNDITPGAPPNLTLAYPCPHALSSKTITARASPKLTPVYSSLHPRSSKIKVPEASTNLMPGCSSPLTLSHRDVTPEVSASLALECPQGVQQFTRAFGIPKTQGSGQFPDTKELGDFSLPSSGEGHGGTAPNLSPGTSGMNVFRTANPVPFPQSDTAPYSAVALPSAFPPVFCDKLSLSSGKGTVLEVPHQAVPASPERSSLPMSGMPSCMSGSQVDRVPELMETQLEGHLRQIWEILVSLVPQDTNAPLPGPKEGPVPTHWRSPEERTSSGSGGGSRQSLLKNTTPGPHLSGQEGGLGSRTYFSASSSVGMHLLAQQRWEVACKPSEQEGPWMEPGIAGNLGARSQNKSELHSAAGASQLEPEPGETSSMEPLTPEAGESRALLSRCFKAWRCHLLGQRAVARALRRRHLLRKGIRAMRWSLWLREAQMEYMKRKQGRTVLATSFQKWKDLYLNRREKKLLTQSRTETPMKDLLPSQEGQQERSFVTPGVVCGVEGAPKIQLHPRWKSGSQSPKAPATRDLQRLAAHWGPAAFHLWYLQKVLVAEIRKEAQARAKLGKKKLRRVFQAWRARTVNSARICTLVTRHQRAQLGRCFGAWIRRTQRKTWCQGRLARWQVETLRKSLQQWVKMVWLQATHSRTVAQLYLLRQRSWHLEVTVDHEGSSRGPVSHGPGEQDQPCCLLGVRAKDSLEEACRKLKLHRVVLLWSRRLAQHQRADSFSQSRTLRLLQNALQRWRQKAQAAESPLASCTGYPPEPAVGSQDSEESPPSSGFLSRVSAPPGPGTPRSSSEEARSPTDSSRSLLSLAGDGPPWVQPLGLSSISSEASESWRIAFPLGQKWSQFWEWQHPGPGRQLLACPFPGEETSPRTEAVQVPRDPGHLDRPWPEAGWQQGSQKALEAKHHCQSRVICSWNLWAAAQGVWWELVCQQRVWGLTQEALHRWPTSWQRQQVLQELGHQWTRCRLYILKMRAYGGWSWKASVRRNAASCQESHFQAWNHMMLTALNLWVKLQTLQAIQRRTLADLAEVTDCQGQDWRTAVSQIYHARQHCLLRSPRAHWNAVLPRGMPRHQLTKEEEGTSVGPRPRTNAIYPQRLAFRGCHILDADPDALGKQPGNYWTRATAPAQAKRKPHSHIGQRKMSVSLGKEGCSGYSHVGQRKMSVSPGGPKQSFSLLSSPRLPLHCSSFQPWLQLYQRQSRAKGLTSQEGPRKSTRGQEEGSSRTVQIPKSRAHWRAAALEETCLERKYLQRWRHEALLRRFHGQQRKRRLAEVWQCWIDAQGSEQLARTLVRQRWLEWGWGTWRRRWLQLQVALCLQDHRVLSQAFGRWHQRWAARVPRRGGTSQ